MKCTSKKQNVSKGTLNSLDKVELSEKNHNILENVRRSSRGPRYWQDRKPEESRDALALEQISNGRISIKEIDATEALQIIMFMKTLVPLQPNSKGKLEVADGVILGLTYRKEAVILPQPGYSYVQILSPNNIWHANVGELRDGQPLCLGDKLPAAIPIKEIVLMTYGALSMQTIMINEMDSSGVLNPTAAKWWQHNLDKIPLSKEPFIRTDSSNSVTG
ncbi:hypothetical protein AYK24_07275 [Thermoplasmatales archaeon SG8-52-4]|nr:MAG: hypothetical protein AYK24_07275 [Thermoplasmatales archaeon SG8-52-4]